jgi:hypothetical protein
VKASNKSIKRRLNFYLASLCILRGWFVGEKVKMERGWSVCLRGEEMGGDILFSLSLSLESSRGMSVRK